MLINGDAYYKWTVSWEIGKGKAGVSSEKGRSWH
jgi:hypothetical protein